MIVYALIDPRTDDVRYIGKTEDWAADEMKAAAKLAEEAARP